MSFRHTAITEFLYKGGQPQELDAIEKVLNEYGHFEWCGKGMPQLGYFHGVIKDLNGYDTKEAEQRLIDEILEETGVRIKIVIE